MAFAPLLILAGTALTAGAAVYSGVQAHNQGKYQSALAEQNARLSQQRAAAEAARLRRDTMRRLGATTAGFGASGVTLAGTPGEVLGDQAVTLEEDSTLVLFDGAADARRHRAEGAAAAARGEAALVGSALGATGTLFAGAGTYAENS